MRKPRNHTKLLAVAACLISLSAPSMIRAQAVPVGQDAVPIGQGAVPIGQYSVPVGAKSGPVGQDAVPVGENSGPVGQDAVPVGQDAVPVGQDAVPVGANSGPVGQDAVPVGQDAVPVGQDAVPVGQDAVPVGQDAVPIGATSVPVGQGAVPIGANSVPVGQDATPLKHDFRPAYRYPIPDDGPVKNNLDEFRKRVGNREGSKSDPRTSHLFADDLNARRAEIVGRFLSAIELESVLSKEVIGRRQFENSQWGEAVRTSAGTRPENLFTAEWWSEYGDQLETPAIYPATRPLDSWWDGASWEDISKALGISESTKPFEYLYDRNVTFHKDVIYVNGQPIANHEDFVVSAKQLATAGVARPDANWTPIGTFLVSTSPRSQSSPQALQLAMDQDGNLTGVYAHWLSKKVHQVQGKVVAETQRAVFSIGSQHEITFETGLANLTEDNVRLWVHLPDAHSQTWLLSRIKTASN